MNPRLIAVNGSKKGTTFPLTDAEATIGRESGNTISLRHASVSRRHCVIRKVGDEFKIADLDSYNGTFVNGIPIKEQTLAHADQLRVGTLSLLFLLEDGEETTSGHLVRLDDSEPVSQSSKLIDSGALLQQTESVLVQFPAGERAARDLAALLRIATRINRLRRTRELVREILDSVFEVVPVDRGAILLTQGDKEFTSVYGKHRLSEGSTVQVSRTVVERVIQEGLAILANDIKTSETLSSAESLVAAQISSLMCLMARRSRSSITPRCRPRWRANVRA
jgi:pSer/pThr/pTyr-binding forkhead associated (FHA) protein